MLNLTPSTYIDIQSSCLDSVFPFASKYYNNAEFQSPKYEWFYITDDSFLTREAQQTWIGLICLTENKFLKEHNLHLSVVEVAIPIRNLKFGSNIIKMLIQNAVKLKYKTLSLQVAEDHLIHFYSKFGFQKMTINNKDIWVLNLE